MSTGRIVSSSFGALWLLGFLVACADAKRGPAEPRVDRAKPVVLIATSAASCDDGNQVNLSTAVEADRTAIETVFSGSKARGAVAETLAVDLRDLSKSDLKAKIQGRPLIVVYSGHGVAVRKGEYETTHLCLPGPELLSTDVLFEWIRKQEPKWATVILNGCETAQVNPAVVAAPPISVISASPSVVTPSLLPGAKGTEFVQVLVSLVGRALDGSGATTLDVNCDGALSDRELFHPLEAELRKREWQRESTATALPVPKLRRNSGVPLPFLYLPDVCNAPEERATRLPELASTLENEREAISAGGLPKARKGEFVLNGVRDHLACLGGKAKGVTARACNELKSALEPVPLDSSAAALREEDFASAVKGLAQRSAGTEIYWLTLDGSWAELRRLRDDGVVGVAHVGNIGELVPRDERRLFSSLSRGQTWRFAGAVSWANLSAQGAVPAVCRAPEGQCFRFPRAPVLTASWTSE